MRMMTLGPVVVTLVMVGASEGAVFERRREKRDRGRERGRERRRGRRREKRRSISNNSCINVALKQRSPPICCLWF